MYSVVVIIIMLVIAQFVFLVQSILAEYIYLAGYESSKAETTCVRWKEGSYINKKPYDPWNF